jgi:hypothetical protein
LSANNLLFFKNLKVATTPKQTMFMFGCFPNPRLRIISLAIDFFRDFPAAAKRLSSGRIL